MRKHYAAMALAASLLAVSVAPAALADDPIVEKVQLWDKPDGSQGMTVSFDKLKAGPVTFVVTNVSTVEDHELLLLKTDMTPDQFPVDESGTRLDEEKLQGINELGDLTKGETSTHHVTLTPGRYVMFCNEPGHFAAGMWHELTVTP